MALFGPDRGAYGQCWCMWWRLTGREFDALEAEGRRAAFQARSRTAPPPGLLAYRAGAPVGWVAVAPRGELGRLGQQVVRHVMLTFAVCDPASSGVAPPFTRTATTGIDTVPEEFSTERILDGSERPAPAPARAAPTAPWTRRQPPGVSSRGAGIRSGLTLKLPLPRLPLIASVLCASEMLEHAAASLIWSSAARLRLSMSSHPRWSHWSYCSPAMPP